MLLCMSTGLRLPIDARAGDLQLAFALCGSAFCVGTGGLIPAQADQGNPVQSAIGLAVTASVQPMPMGLA
jgi:hypothetical protein